MRAKAPQSKASIYPIGHIVIVKLIGIKATNPMRFTVMYLHNTLKTVFHEPDLPANIRIVDILESDANLGW